MKRIMTTLLIAACLSGMAHAEMVWKWTDKNGKAQFGNQPPKGVKAEQIDIKTSKVGTFATPDQTQTPASRKTDEPNTPPTTKYRRIGSNNKNEGGPTVVHLNPEDSPDTCPPVMKSCVKKGERANSQAAPRREPMLDKNGVVRD